jgi:type I restriction enzyme R subunit
VCGVAPDGDAQHVRGKGGVVWHTQGSGKSITMTCFAARVMQEPAMENPTIVVITDRNDLDGQLFGVFSLAQDLLREQPVQATTRQELRALLGNRPSGGIVFATIQKFMPGEDEDTFPLLSDRHNIVVIADEAHRTQYGFEAKLKTVKVKPVPGGIGRADTGLAAARAPEFEPTDRPKYQVGYAQHLRDALPNATFVAFTGTPVSGEDRDTRAVFGDYISVYDMQQAKEDGATVAIYYESRLAKLGLKADELATIDDEVDELAEDEEESQQAKLKSRWAALEKVVGAEPRIASVAADLVAHFEERNKAADRQGHGGGHEPRHLRAPLRRDRALRPDWHSPDPEQGAIKIVMTGSASDKALLRPHIYSGQVKKRLEKRFKNPADPLRLVIVRDMWLTGFDAPCVHTLYVDKPMKGHNLMQAIARVNRVFKDKQGGLVVDYIGIANELKSALKEYTASKGRGRPTVDAHEAYSVLAEKLDALRGMLPARTAWLRTTSGFLTGGHKTLAGAANHVLGIKDGKKRFADTGAGHEQGLHAVLHAGRGQGGARGGGLLPGREGDPDQARHQPAEEDRRAARAGHPPDHQLGGGVRRGGRHLRRRGPGQAQHRHPGRRLPGRGAQPARAQPGGGTAGAPAGRRDQVTLRQQRGAAQEVLDLLGDVVQRYQNRPSKPRR